MFHSKPRGNYQDLLAQKVERYLAIHPELQKHLLELDLSPVESPPAGTQFTLAEIEVPPPEPVSRPASRTGKLRKVDWLAISAQSIQLGKQGEQFVLDLEKTRLRDNGRGDLVGRVEWVSQTSGDGAGYDIRSFDENGDARLIEVKTTKGPESTPFTITDNELRCSEEHGATYRLYRVFRFGLSPKLYRLPGPLTAVLRLEPKIFTATVRRNS